MLIIDTLCEKYYNCKRREGPHETMVSLPSALEIRVLKFATANNKPHMDINYSVRILKSPIIMKLGRCSR